MQLPGPKVVAINKQQQKSEERRALAIEMSNITVLIAAPFPQKLIPYIKATCDGPPNS